MTSPEFLEALMQRTSDGRPLWAVKADEEFAYRAYAAATGIDTERIARVTGIPEPEVRAALDPASSETSTEWTPEMENMYAGVVADLPIEYAARHESASPELKARTHLEWLRGELKTARAALSSASSAAEKVAAQEKIREVEKAVAAAEKKLNKALRAPNIGTVETPKTKVAAPTASVYDPAPNADKKFSADDDESEAAYHAWFARDFG